MKQIFRGIFCIMLFSCSTDSNLFEDILDRGGYIEFYVAPELTINLLQFADFEINATLIDLNNNAISYSLMLISDGIEVPDFIVLNKFPASLIITAPMILDALGISESDLDPTSELQFLATVTTPTGTYTLVEPDFNYDTNEQGGGNSAYMLFRDGYSNQAMNFTVRFFVPPPKKLRGTSFEEPFATEDDYRRPDGDDNNLEGEMFNHVGERHVMHVEQGTGEDDEIGFRSFYFDIGDSGWSNEEIGVTQKTDEVGEFQDGIQGFQFSDIDGRWRVVFDKVTVDASANPSSGCQIKLFVRSTSWEDDLMHIYVEIERVNGDIEVIDLLNATGDGLDDIEGRWSTIGTGFLSDVVSYQLTVDAENSASSEDFFLDEMLVFIPED